MRRAGKKTTMNISVAYGEALAQETPLLVLAGWEDEALPKRIADLVEDGDWSGQFKQTLLLYPRGALPARRVLLLGLGKRGQISFDGLCDAAAHAARRARELHIEQFTIDMPKTEAMPLATAAQAVAEGSQMGLYRYLQYRTTLNERDRHEIAEITIVSNIHDDSVTQGVALGRAVAGGVELARDLANRPGNDLTPTRLAGAAQELGQRIGAQVTVLGPEELRAQGFGGILAVGQGSAQEPRFVVVEYGQKRPRTPTICLVGKGITFDSGGISIKPPLNMDEMKSDMSGAAAVLGALHVVGELKLPLHVVGLIAAAENMPSGTAYKPGDIITTLSGKTVEVLNTDAEGRIVLADALYYAQSYQPDAIIDVATLTGAVMVALGHHASGLFGNDDGLASRLLEAGEATGERAWRLPLWDPYKEMVRSEIADIRNTGGSRFGAAITAAAFLANFVGDYPWAHLDIAGTAYSELAPKKAYASKGAIGVGVRLLTYALRMWAESRR
jgi:leucyl aminopeptidase